MSAEPPNGTAAKVLVNADQAGAPVTKLDALKARGWILPFDYAIVAVLLTTFVTLVFWKIFGQPTVLNFIAAVALSILAVQLWIVALVFRCSCFVIETQADINLMPEAAARIVAGFYSNTAGVAGTQNRQRK